MGQFVMAFDAKFKVTTLHCVGGCKRVQQLPFKQYELFMEKVVPPQDSFTELCWACWPNGMGTTLQSRIRHRQRWERALRGRAADQGLSWLCDTSEVTKFKF